MSWQTKHQSPKTHRPSKTRIPREHVENKNIIPHIWKLANIVHIPKPNTDIDKGTSYRHISLNSVIAKTLEKSLLPYRTGNIRNTPTQHWYKTQHSKVTALHTLNSTVAKGFNQMAAHARTITIALDLSKDFDTINIHTLIRKLLHTKIPCTLINFIANYIKGRKTYPTYRHHTFSQRQFKTGLPQDNVLSPTLYNILHRRHTTNQSTGSGHSLRSSITITSTHTGTSAAKKYIQLYIHKFLSGKNKTISHKIKTKHLALCSLQTIQNIRAIWTSK